LPETFVACEHRVDRCEQGGFEPDGEMQVLADPHLQLIAGLGQQAGIDNFVGWHVRAVR
jgi:hypothetical protein